MKPAALILAPEAPYPLTGGGALRTASLVEDLARTPDVHLIVIRQPGAPDQGQLCGMVRGSQDAPARHYADQAKGAE